MFLCNEKLFIMNHDIFISYSRHDTDVVNELVALLEKEGYSIWIDRDGIESGDDFKRVILRAIKESSIVLFFSSKHSNVSEWTAKEIGIAVKYKKHIIPIMLDDSNFNEAVEFDLINLDYIDYSKEMTRLAMRERLLNTLCNKLGKRNDNGKDEAEKVAVGLKNSEKGKEEQKKKSHKVIEEVKRNAYKLAEEAKQKAYKLAEEAKQKAYRESEEAKRIAYRVSEEAKRKAYEESEEAKQKASRALESAKQKAYQEAEEAKQKAYNEAEEAKRKVYKEAEEAKQKAYKEAEEAKQKAYNEAEEAKQNAIMEA